MPIQVLFLNLISRKWHEIANTVILDTDTEIISTLHTGIRAFDSEYLGRPFHRWYLFRQMRIHMGANVTLSEAAGNTHSTCFFYGARNQIPPPPKKSVPIKKKK